MNDLDQLLEPVGGESPTGRDIRSEEAFRALRHARIDEDPALPQGIWERPLVRADWSKVEEQCAEILREQSKDLQVAVWLCEALTNRDGPAGLARSMDFITALSRRYWADIFPAIDPEDPDVRLAPFYWLNEKMPLALRRLPIAQEPAGELGEPLWGHWRLAEIQERQPSGREGTTKAELLAAMAETPGEFYRGLFEHIAAAREAIGGLTDCLRELCDGEPPSLSNLSGELEAMQALVAAALESRGEPASADGAALSEDTTEAMAAAAPVHALRHDFGSREEAYLLLHQIADFLERIEPHSPTPYLIRRAVAWGHKPLPELMAELSADFGSIDNVMRLLGMTEEQG